MQNKDKKTGVSLYVTLSAQDAEFLRVAISAGPPAARPFGQGDIAKLAESALGSVCRTILANGYRPRPLLAQLSPAAVPANTVVIQFPGRAQ